MSSTEDEILLDERWIASFKKKVSDTKKRDEEREPTIYRIPDIIKQVDPEAYEPLLVSIGPYHRDKPHLRAMNQVKWKYLKFFCESNSAVTLEQYLDEIKRLEERAREAYSEEVKMSSESFVEMMLLDGCFLMLTMMEWVCNTGTISKEITKWTENVVVRDIFMLENQLPFCILKALYTRAYPSGISFGNQTVRFISKLTSSKLELPCVDDDTFHHIIHLFLCCINPTNPASCGCCGGGDGDSDIDSVGGDNDGDGGSGDNDIDRVGGDNDGDGGSGDGNAIDGDSDGDGGGSNGDAVDGGGDVDAINGGGDSDSSGDSNSGRSPRPWPYPPPSPDRCPPSPCRSEAKISNYMGLIINNFKGMQIKKNYYRLKKILFLCGAQPPIPIPLAMVHNPCEAALPIWIPSATAFNEAGVHFKRKTTAKNFLDITFRNGKLEIPQLHIEDRTNSILRNLIAYEQCSMDSEFHVTSYVRFMDYLIDTAADVELLQQDGIIISHLGDNQVVATLFNKLGLHVGYDNANFYLAGVVEDMRKYHNITCNKWRAKLNHDYFSNPWAAISLFGALVLFVLAVTQTILAILRYVRS